MGFFSWLFGIDKYRSDWEAYNRGAYQEKIIEDHEKYMVKTMLLNEARSLSGKTAVCVMVVRYNTGLGSLAIHEVNKTGDGSKKGPYFVSRKKWKVTSVVHICLVVETKEDYGFPSSNPYQCGPGSHPIRRSLLQVIEFNTAQYRPMDLWDYAFRQKEKQS